MKRSLGLSFLILLGILAMPARSAFAVVEIDAYAYLSFAESCMPTDGFWHASHDPQAPFQSDELIAVNWSPSMPVSVNTLAPQSVSETGELQAGKLFLVLVAADRETILFKGEFQLVDPPGPERRLELKALLDCSVVPYRVVASSDTAVPTGKPPITSAVGVVLFALATLLLIDRQTRWLRPSPSAWYPGRRDIDASRRCDART